MFYRQFLEELQDFDISQLTRTASMNAARYQSLAVFIEERTGMYWTGDNISGWHYQNTKTGIKSKTFKDGHDMFTAMWDEIERNIIERSKVQS